MDRPKEYFTDFLRNETHINMHRPTTNKKATYVIELENGSLLVNTDKIKMFF
jgi:hypothetical protein